MGLYVYTDGNGDLRFGGKDPVAERIALQKHMAYKRECRERLHERNMALLGDTEDPTRRNRTREVVHVVQDESEEALWQAWRAYSGT